MPQICSYVRTNHTSRATTAGGKYRRSSSLWRNPCVIFCITFGVLGTLRLRKPTQRAVAKLRGQPSQTSKAQQILTAGRHPALASTKTTEQRPLAGVPAQGREPTVTLSRTMPAIRYELMEEGELEDGAGFLKYQAIDASGQQVPLLQWIQVMASASRSGTAESLRSHPSDSLTGTLQRAPFTALYWETPPANKATMSSQPFQFVLVDAPRLAAFADGRPDASAFASQLQACASDSVCSFENLGKDAMLVVPQRLSDGATHYGHLASFVREAPLPQVRQLWSRTAERYLQRMEERDKSPVWLSTSGTGVAWLHMRLDDRPKYYTYEPYRVVPTSGAVRAPSH